MSFHINSDKEKIRGVNSKFIGDNEATIRIGTGADEKEVLRAELDSTTQLPRIGINRTGQRVNNIVLDTAGSGYTVNPTVTIGPPNVAGGVQALASAFIFNGKVTTIAVNNPGSGYTVAPLVTISEGGGAGATATAVLDTVDYELDINGAIRTSTSIISDTARILNLDIDNFVTPDANFRGPNLKTYMNNTGTLWSANVILQKDQYRYFGANVYQALNTGQTGSEAPEHLDGIVKNGSVEFKHIGFRVNDPNEFRYNDTGDAGVFPRSITPLLGDRSDKIATTEYVLNLATNDVGGRIYVSAQIGSDLNDGRSAVNPVRTIKKAAQEAWKTPGVKETIIVSGGDYVEDNPISLPPDASIVGDNLRLVIIRPANPGKHMVKFGDKNYVIGVTYRDQIDSNGDAVATWDYAMVFDDKQRIMVDSEANGDFGTTFPVGHQIFGPQQFRVTFQNNTGLATLVSGLIVKGVNTGSRAKIFDVNFATTIGASAYVNGTVDVQLQSGSFVEGEQFNYITSAGAGSAINLAITGQQGLNTLRFSQDPTGTIPGGTVVQLVGTPSSGLPFTGFYEVSAIDTTQSASNIWDVTFFPILNAPTWDATGVGGTYVINQATTQTETIDTTAIKSIRAEGEVVSVDEDYTTSLPISRIDFSLQGDPSITQGGFQNAQFGNAEDSGGIVFYTNQLVGRTNTHEFKEGQEILLENLPTSNPDLSVLNGKQRIYKVLEDADGRCRRFVIPKKMPAITDANLDPGQFATVKSFSKVVTLSLLNSPNSFPLSTPVERRFQDACVLLRNNREFIADEVVGRINKEFANPYYQVSEISGGGDTFKVYLGQTPVTHTYVSGGTVKFENATINITNFVYDNAVTGYATITIASALSTLVEDDTVKLADILLSCDAGQKTYPSYSSPTSGDNTGSDGDEQCRQDVIHFINALVRDLEFGSNFNVIDAANKYVVGGDIAYIKDEIVQNFRAIEYARELCIYAMRNWRTENGNASDPIYSPLYSSVARYFDDTIITATAGTPACADVKSAIDTLSYLWADIITKNQSATYLDAAYLIERNKYLIADQALRDTLGQFPLFALSNTNERKCKRDLRITLSNLAKDLVFGGNENIVIAAEEYFTQTALTGIPEAQRAETIFAYQQAKTYAIAAMRNWTDGSYVDLTPTNATYNPATGALEVIFPDPLIAPNVGDRIAFKEDALNWQCTYNSVTGQHPGPSRTDPTFGKSFAITQVQSSGGVTTVSTNVGDAGAASGSAHTFVSAVTDGTIIVYNPTVLTSPIPKFEDWNILPDSNAGAPSAQYTPSAVTYNPVNGDLTMTVTGHSVTTSNSVRVAADSLVFTCTMDGDATEHTYPQAGQPAYGNAITVDSTTTDTFTINVGATGADQQWTPTDATYDPATGALVLTIGSGHGLSIGEGVVLDNDSLSFTCTMDGNSATKTYPRAGHDPFSGRSIPIDSVTDTTVTLNVGVSPANKNFTPTTGTQYNPATGDLILNIGQHGLAVGKSIVIADDTLKFTCAKDNNSTNHTYPRSSDPASGESLEITSVSSTSHTATNAVYTASTGKLVITSAGHGFSNGDYVKIADGSLTFSCDLDGNTVNKAYPRNNYDNLSGRWVQISNKTTDTFEINTGPSSYTGSHTFVSATASGIERQTGNITVNVGASPQVNHTPTGATYDPATGDLVLTIGAHTLSVGEGVKIADNSLTFTCSQDGGVSTHTYPRPLIDNHTATDAAYNPTTGILTLTVASHGIKVGDWVKLDDNSLTFTCAEDGNGTQHTYPRSTDPISGKYVVVSAVTTDTFDIQVLDSLPSTNTTVHTFVSAVGNGIKQKRDRAHDQAVVITAVGTGTITVNVGPQGGTQYSHTFTAAAANAVVSGGGYTHTFVSAVTDGVQFIPQSAHTFVSAATNALKHLPRSAHTFVRAATNSVLIYSTGVSSQCANVESSINTSMGLFEDILDGTVLSGATARTSNALYDTAQLISYPDNYITDANNNRLAIRGDYDDYPIIEASPYTQNASVISFLGGGGAEVDGDKVKQPNCPFPGLELDGSASFPNQGKSMVASAFTIVSFGGTGYKITNDGYVQLVSVFVIFCADGVLAESGGYASITNSATNFGTFALRARGFSESPYVFDIATISNVSSTPTGRTILTVSGLGREPLEHYVVKIDGYTNTNTEIEYFIDVVAGVTVGPPFSAQLTIDDGTGGAMDLTDIATGQAVSTSVLSGKTINLHRPSIVNSSSHTWEFAGSGTNYLALPENGGTKIEAYEQVSENYGRVYVSGTDELGDFKVGTFARIENRTGNITFTGTVTISEVEFLKLKGGDVVVTGFDASNTLGGANSSDSKLPTQKAVRDYITNNLGPYINKPYSTNAVPRALVELTDSGKISVDQIPALRPFSVFTVADQAERTSLEGALAGDIAIQQDTSTSFILNNDTDSLFLGFNPDAALAFTTGDIFTGSLTTGRIQATEYRKGVVYQINVSNGGSGYTVAPTITFSGGNPEAGAVAASATCTIANGQVVTVTINAFGGFTGGKGYTTAPTVTFAAPAGAGTQAQGTALIESRLYGDIVNNIKIEDTDTFDDSTTPTATTVNITRVVNTSSFDANNWVSLSSNQIAASDITSGVIETDRLALGGAANSFTFLRGDSNFALAMQSLKGAESRYFARLASQCTTGSSQMIFTTNSDVLIGHEVKNTVSGVQSNTNITGVITAAGLTTISLNNPVNATIPLGTIIEFERGASPLTFESTFTQGNFVDNVIIANGGNGYTNGQYFDVSLTGGSGTGLKVNIVVSNNVVTELTVTDGGTGYSADFTVTTAPGAIGGGSSLVLEAKVSTVNRQYANVAIDVQRVTDLTISADLYGTIGVSRFKKSQFNIGTSGNGSIELKTGADSGLDADLLDGVQGSFYLNSSNQSAGTLSSDRLSGTYNIAISGTAGNTIRVLTGTNNPSSSPAPSNFSSGIVSNTIFNSANGLSDGGTRNMTVTFRNGGTGFDAGFGGVRQLAFTDNDNMWIRGSGTGVGSFGTWAKVWTALNDGLDSGLDADKLDNRQGTWYQNALNINEGTLSDNRLPRFISATNFRDNVTVKGFLGDPKFRIYFSGVILDTSSTGVFAPGNPINLYNSNAQAVGSFIIDSVTTNDDTADNFNDYTILIGRLNSGNFVGALTAGSASNRQPFDDFTLEDGNTVDVGKIVNNAGSGELKLGRVDGQSSNPAIYFRSSQLVSNGDNHYTAKLEAAGGNASAGSGTLALTVLNADAFTINGQKAWNEGNIQFSSANLASYAVQRDGSGNFSAGTITANLTGAASLNVLKTGDTMTGSLVLTGAGSNLTVSGTTTINNTTTINADLNVDSNTLFVDASENKIGIGETVFTNRAGQSYVKLRMRTSNFDGYDDDHRMDFGQFNGNWVDGSGGSDTQFGMAFTWQSQVRGGLLYDHRSSERMALWSSYGRLAFMVDPGTSGDEVPNTVGTEAMTIVPSGTVGINTTGPSTSYKLDVNGATRLRNFVTLDQANDNSGAGIQFLGSSSERNFRIGNQWGHSNAFEITPSTGAGNSSWDGTPAIYVRGDHRVGIYTSSISGTDPTNNQVRSYRLNVNGDMNINGQFFQNNQEFVTSRWTEASNGNDIFRLSRVGVKKQDPTYDLHVAGSVNIEGQTFSNQANTSVLYANGVRQWIDSYGIFKANSQVVAENITVPNGTNCGSFGPITINNNIVITVADGGSWNIV